MKSRHLFALSCSILLSASPVWAGSGWTSYGQVLELNPTTFKRFKVKIAVTANPSKCQQTQFFYHYYDGAGSEYMFNTLLAAVTSGKKVRVYVTGACDIDGYNEITSVSIAP